MTKESEAAALLGRKGGLSRSEAKVTAVRQNGKLGGRPRGNMTIASKSTPQGTFRVRANFADASSPIQYQFVPSPKNAWMEEDRETWLASQFQVADARHKPRTALTLVYKSLAS